MPFQRRIWPFQRLFVSLRHHSGITFTYMTNTRFDLTSLGLTSAEVAASRTAGGSNVLMPPKRPSVWKLYLEKFKDPIIRILLVAALISLGIGLYEHEFVETIGIVAAIFLATSIGFYFEYDAQKRFDALSALGQEEMVTVVRDGRVTQVSLSELVVGDVVLLEPGCVVPADGRLIDAVNLKVNESSLTGEPISNKQAGEPEGEQTTAYPQNVVLRSSTVADGHGVMEVTAVGDRTEIGKVARQATAETETKTPLNEQLERLAHVISRWALVVSLLVFVICTVTGVWNYMHSFHPQPENMWIDLTQIVLKNFMLAVTLIVMAVPEGLPMAVTLSLALNMRRMLKTNNLVRRMHACETMGAITVICTDKMGTLTENRMEISDLRYEENDAPLLFENMAVNSTAHLETSGATRGIGDPTECALLLHLNKVGRDYMKLRREAAVVSQLPFSTERKFMATVVDSPVAGGRVLYVKGAPEVVAAMCDMSDALKTETGALIKDYQGKAMRTLAFAVRKVGDDEAADAGKLVGQGGLKYLALAAIMDPVRKEVPGAVSLCREAGIKVKIVTGDGMGTATEIARRIGLWTEEDTDENRITGPEFAALSDEEALRRVEQLKIMSRARPLDKQRLVQLLQKNGEVVAVTGDGTNDAPALNFAQVGLSMGSGTTVAKEASDITLIDDSFSSIVTAVMWGRSLYKNIQRFIGFQLTISLTALIITLAGSIIGTEMPLTVTQILWINLIIDTFASLALSTIPPSAAVMREKPRRTTDFILNSSLLRNIVTTTVLFSLVMTGLIVRYDTPWMAGSDGVVSPYELTIIFTFFVMLQFWNLFNAKAWDSGRPAFANLRQCRGLLLVLAIILITQILIVEFGGYVFRTEPLTLMSWIKIIVISSLTLWIGEVARFLGNRGSRQRIRA